MPETHGSASSPAPLDVPRLVDMLTRMTMEAREAFEVSANAFYRETGLMAPGKDVPAAMGGQPDFRERFERFCAWSAARTDRDREHLRALAAALSGLAERWDLLDRMESWLRNNPDSTVLISRLEVGEVGYIIVPQTAERRVAPTDSGWCGSLREAMAKVFPTAPALDASE